MQIVTSKNIPAVVNSIKSLVRPRASVKNQNSCNTSNLLKVPKSFDVCSNTTLPLVSLNARSVKIKATSVCDFLTSNNVDILALTETWLGSSIDKSIIAEITPNSYDLQHISRNDRKAVIFNKNLDVKPVASKNSFSHFELLECNLSATNHRFWLCVIYRPPPSRINKLKTSTFFEECSEFLDHLIIIPEEIVITGDLNVHLDDKNNSDACKFLETLEDHGLKQHVNGPTQIHGHTLDVIITRDISPILMDVPVVQDPHLCDRKGNPIDDHMALISKFRISRLPKCRLKVNYHKYREINLNDIGKDISDSVTPILNETEPVGNLVNLYDTNLKLVVDRQAPIVSKEITIQPNTEWHTEELRITKRDRQKAERRMRNTNLFVHQ